jgi:eukaryotic-like serine/threonine-protein kinase
MTALAMAPTRDLVAGKYELVALLGRGAMGSVWEGRHTSLGTRVAIKFIEDEHLENQDLRRRFMNEARAAASLSSKHAITVYDFGVTAEDKPFIVMELLAGETLDKRLAKVGRLSLPDVARIVHQVCRALQQAHEHGIIHRDLKPGTSSSRRQPTMNRRSRRSWTSGSPRCSSMTP